MVYRFRQPIATFKPSRRGVLTGHNHLKVACFIALYGRQLTLRQLCRRVDGNYASIKTSLCRWVRFKYVNRRAVIHEGRPVYCYTLAVRGNAFLNIVPINVLRDITEHLKKVAKGVLTNI